MDLNLVSAFVRVVEAQSFTLAAKALGLPKSSVSRRVTELERELGVQLLKRTTRKLSLTEAGRSYFEQAERALSGLDAAAEAAAGLDKEARGIVRVTAAVDLGLKGLSDLLADFCRLYPEIHVELSLDSRIVNLVEEGFDIAIRGGRSRDPSLVARRIGNSDLGLFAAPHYLEKRGLPTKTGDLSRHDCVLFRAKHGKAIWRLDGPNDEVVSIEVRGPIATDELLFVHQAVASGLGIGLIPVFAAAGCRRERGIDVVRVLPDYAMRGGEIQVLTPSGTKRPHRVTLLRDFLVENMTLRCERAESPRTALSEPVHVART